MKRIDVREHGLTATLFALSAMRQGPAVIVLGGSGGGFGWSHQVAAVLASHGCTAIAVAYFDWQGKDNLPNQLVEIPLECIGLAIQYLLSPSVRRSLVNRWKYLNFNEFSQRANLNYTNRRLSVEKNLKNLTIIGYSKGAELALAAATNYLEINQVIAYLPSSVIWHGFQLQGSAPQSSWQYQAQPLSFLSFANGYFDEAGWQDSESIEQARIAVEKIRG